VAAASAAERKLAADALKKAPAPAKKKAGGAELLAAIASAPDDDGPRLVYADFLVEKGDPCGELIQLQIARARAKGEKTKREEQLYKKHWRALLGALAPAVKGAVFERGFLVDCEAELRTEKQRAELVNHPLWSTVKKIESKDLLLLRSPAMASLREVVGLDLDAAAALASGDRPLATIEKISLMHFAPFAEEQRRALTQLRALPSLRAATIMLFAQEGITTLLPFADARWVLGGRMAEQLRELFLRLPYSPPDAAAWADAWRSTKIERFTVEFQRSLRVEFTKKDGVVLEVDGLYDFPAKEIARAAKEIPGLPSPLRVRTRLSEKDLAPLGKVVIEPPRVTEEDL
jgi:uncharacterized protein (TIGR02996 family)